MSINSLLTNQPVLNGLKEIIGGGYVLPVASESVLGGVKIDGTSIVINDDVISAVGGGSGNTSLWADYPAVDNVDLDSKNIDNIKELNGIDYLPITANSLVNHIGEIDIYTNYSIGGTTPACEINLENGGLFLYTFPGGFNNPPNTASLDMAGVFTVPALKVDTIVGITFSDNTVQTTAATAPANWSTIPATQSVNMDNKKILNVDEVSAGTSDYLSASANSLVNHTGIIDIYTNWTEGGTNDVPASEFYLNNNGASLYTYPNGYDGAYKQATLDMAGVFTAPKFKVSGTSGIGIDCNRSQIENVTNIIGNTTQDTYIFTQQEQGLYLYTNNDANADTITSGISLDTNGVTIYTEKLSTGFTRQEATLDVNGLFTIPSLKINTGSITYPDTTTSNSGVIKGTRTLSGGTVTINDALITTGAICVATYAIAPPIGGVLGAVVTAGQIVISSSLLTDNSPIFFMYYI
jgi:hypothetical protein